MSFRILLYTEGPAEDRGEDAFLPPPNEPLLEQHCGPAHHLVARVASHVFGVPRPAIQFLTPARTKAKKARGSDLHDSKIVRRLCASSGATALDLIVVLVDEDGDPTRRPELVAGTRGALGAPVIAVAVREFESWLIADQGAVVDALGTRQTPRAPESMQPREAKTLLRGWIEEMAPAAQSERAAYLRERRIALARKADLQQLCRLDSFRRFLEDLRERAAALG